MKFDFTLKEPSKVAADDTFMVLLLSFEGNKARSCESSVGQRIHTKYQLFSLKNNEKYSRLSSAAVVIGALRINSSEFITLLSISNADIMVDLSEKCALSYFFIRQTFPFSLFLLAA